VGSQGGWSTPDPEMCMTQTPARHYVPHVGYTLLNINLFMLVVAPLHSVYTSRDDRHAMEEK